MSRADFSRLRFNLKKHFRNVLSQQGRVWLDSDWNEESETRAYQDEERSLDLIGRCGVPAPYTAFRIDVPSGNDFDFRIGGGPDSAGDFYVDGILARNERPTTYTTQPDLPFVPPLTAAADGSQSFGLAYLEVWERTITYLEDDTLREVALDGPDTAVRTKTIAQVRILNINSSLTCEAAAALLPSPLGQGTLTTLQSPQAPDPADICRLPQEVTFTGRENRLYRVEIHEAGDVLGGPPLTNRFSIPLAQDVAAGAQSIKLNAPLTLPATRNLREGGSVTLTDDAGRRESVFVTAVDTGSAILRFTRPLRTAFTVAAHTNVTGGVARFKWSRSNGAFAVGVTDVSTDLTKLTLTSLGRDAATALRDGDLVEISGDATELGLGRGHLTRLDGDPNPDELTVVLEDPLPVGFNLQPHVTLRRWDGEGFASAAFDEITTPDMNLGDGVHVQFGGGDLRVAEYWQVVTRVIDGSVEALVNAPPRGIVRHRCPLAVVQWGPIAPIFEPGLGTPPEPQLGKLPEPAPIVRLPGTPPIIRQPFSPPLLSPPIISLPPQLLVTAQVLSDCRRRIPLLTRMILLHYVGGDGQECIAGDELIRPLEVGVTNGPFAMPGMTVRFFASVGGVVRSGTTSGQTINVQTNADGVAQCFWKPLAQPGTQTVLATLQLTPEDQILCNPLYVMFNAKVEPRPEEVMVVKEVTDGKREVVENDQDLPIARLMSGLIVVLDSLPDGDSIKRPTVFVSIEIPEPFSDTRLGFETIHLRGEVEAIANTIVWKPDDRVEKNLLGFLQNFQTEERFLTHLTLRGNFIWSQDDPPRFLDGDSFAEPGKKPPIALRLPSGDTRPGGDFRMWFWLRVPPRRRRLVFNASNLQLAQGVSLAIRRAELAKLVPDFIVDTGAVVNPGRARTFFSTGLQVPLLTIAELDSAASFIQTELQNVGAITPRSVVSRETIIASVSKTPPSLVFMLLPEDVYDGIREFLPASIRDAIVLL